MPKVVLLLSEVDADVDVVIGKRSTGSSSLSVGYGMILRREKSFLNCCAVFRISPYIKIYTNYSLPVPLLYTVLFVLSKVLSMDGRTCFIHSLKYAMNGFWVDSIASMFDKKDGMGLGN